MEEKEIKKSWGSSHLHVGVDHLLELVGSHLGHGVDQVEQFPADRVVGTLATREHGLNILQKKRRK